MLVQVKATDYSFDIEIMSGLLGLTTYKYIGIMGSKMEATILH